MKCIDKKKKLGITVTLLLICTLISGCSLLKPDNVVAEYEMEAYNKDLYRSPLWAEEICVTAGDVSLPGAPDAARLKAAALFDMNGKTVDFAYQVHERLYPASTTKLMTALVALKRGNLSDVVTTSSNATNFAPDEQICGLKTGDQLTLKDLLYGLIVYSGNDNAVAIAEHVGGSSEAFAEMMNEQAKEIMATNTHFTNPSGLHDENHYTTAYDLYLIFQECMKLPDFMEMIQASSYNASITGADGVVRQETWKPTNFYALGEVPLPQNATIIGGKTGTTKPAGNCLILLENDSGANPYISVVMGADTKAILYEDMTALINAIPQKE